MEIDLNNLPKGYTVFDAAEYLKTEDDIEGFMEAVFEIGGNDPEYIAHALGTVARARGMAKVARKAKLSRPSLYTALSADGNPQFSTILKVINALGLKMQLVKA